MSDSRQPRGVRIALPATSANLGPGFDTAGLALSMHLTVEAHAAPVFQVHATGRDPELCGAVDGNLILETYRDAVERAGRKVGPLRLAIHNEIPLGMGCGSSAAALLAGVALADHFGGLKLSDEAMVAEASRREGHPDNVAACWYGGFTVSAQQADKVDGGDVHGGGVQGGEVRAATFAGDPAWEMMLAVPPTSLATEKARALLPESYSRADAVFNVQRASLLVAAFAQRRLDLLALAMQDRMHQPYRAEACPLLKTLLPLAAEAEGGFAGVALSGAGPSVLLFLAEGTTLLAAETRLRGLLEDGVELLPLRIAEGAVRTLI